MKMCAAFASNGHTVTLIAPSYPDSQATEQRELFEYYGVPESFQIARLARKRGRLSGYLYAVRAAFLIKRFSPDLVFSRNLLGSLAAILTNIPHVLELHHPLFEESRVQSRMFHRLIKHSAFKRLIVITKPLKEIFQDTSNLRAEQILVAADGADLVELSDRQAASTEKIKAGYFGHLFQGRGIELLMDVAERCPEVDFHIIGGNSEDIERIKNLAASQKNFQVHGFVDPGKAERLRQEMDILLAPYQRKVGLATGSMTTEKWMSPLKVFEYMASGKAIICSDIPVLRKVLQHDHNCILCVPDSAEEWSTAIHLLEKSSMLRVTLGEQAREDLEREYTWKIRANKVLAGLRNS